MKNIEKKSKPMSNIGYNMMSAMFAIRDRFSDPIKKIKKAKISLGQCVLDYGCGPGAYTIAAAKAVGPDGKVYAADIHHLSAKAVKKKSEKKGLKNIEFIQTDCRTGLNDNSVDVVICFDMLHFVKNKTELFEEFHRVMKQNSLLSLDCHHMTNIQSTVEGTDLFKLSEQIGNTFNFKKK